VTPAEEAALRSQVQMARERLGPTGWRVLEEIRVHRQRAIKAEKAKDQLVEWLEQVQAGATTLREQDLVRRVERVLELLG
jgi:hypothetical protein